MNILIVQKNTGKAGAQNSLRRLLKSEAFRKENVTVVTGRDGWFVDQVKLLGIPIVSVDFPSSRSLYGRLIGNALWSYLVVKALRKSGFIPDVLQANNHVEVPFLKMLKQTYGAAITSVFLRDGYIDEASYIKYECHECDIRVVVSQAMSDAIPWDRDITVIENGVFDDEIYPVTEPKASFPSRWLVVGNPKEGKGWFDFLAALKLLYDSQYLNGVEQIVFTGVPFGELSKRYENICSQYDGKLAIKFGHPFENLGKACQNFDVIVSPSRRESFGMAMLEACCSGKCVVSSNTGIAERIISDPKLLFTPGNIDELAGCLRYVLSEWQKASEANIEGLKTIRQSFSVEKNAKRLLAIYREVARDERAPS